MICYFDKNNFKCTTGDFDIAIISDKTKYSAIKLRSNIMRFSKKLIDEKKNLNIEINVLRKIYNNLSKGNNFLSTDVLKIISRFYNIDDILVRIEQQNLDTLGIQIYYKKFTKNFEEININENEFNKSNSLKLSYYTEIDRSRSYTEHFELLEKVQQEKNSTI